jgi:hypothetical protein
MNYYIAATIVVVLLARVPEAGADGNSVPTGRWQGGGRACAGKLDIAQRTLSWRTPFSRCIALPFKFIDMGDRGGIGRTLFTFERATPGCPFTSVELLRKAGQTGQAGDERWEVIGYRSEAERQAGRLDGALACPLVRIK